MRLVYGPVPEPTLKKSLVLHFSGWWDVRQIPIVNEVSGKKSSSRAKLKAASQEIIPKWKEHSKNMLKNSPKVTDKPIRTFQEYAWKFF